MQRGKLYFPYLSDTTTIWIKELREGRVLINSKCECKSSVLFSLPHQLRWLLVTMAVVHIKGLYLLYLSCENRTRIWIVPGRYQIFSFFILDSDVGWVFLSLSQWLFGFCSQCNQTLSLNEATVCGLTWATAPKAWPPLWVSHPSWPSRPTWRATFFRPSSLGSSGYPVVSCVNDLTLPQDHNSGKVSCSPKTIKKKSTVKG